MTYRKLHYDCLMIGVPANNVGEVLDSILTRVNVKTNFDISSKTTIGQIMGELGYFPILKLHLIL